MPTMETTTTSPTVLAYDPANPHFHYLKARRSVDALWESVPFEQRSEIHRLISEATREAFIRGMDPSRPFA